MSDNNSTRPKDTHGSWVVQWSGKNNEVPTMASSNWAPGYTPAHCATQGEALASAMAKVTQETAIVRQRWISLSMILEQNREAYQNEVADGVSALIADVPGITVPGSFQPKVRHRIYDTDEARIERSRQLHLGYGPNHDDEHGLKHLERIRDSYLGKVGGQIKIDAMQLAIDDWKYRNQNGVEGYDDHPDH